MVRCNSINTGVKADQFVRNKKTGVGFSVCVYSIHRKNTPKTTEFFKCSYGGPRLQIKGKCAHLTNELWVSITTRKRISLQSLQRSCVSHQPCQQLVYHSLRAFFKNTDITCVFVTTEGLIWECCSYDSLI